VTFQRRNVLIESKAVEQKLSTMKREEQVCSLELAKRIKELGVKQSSAFYWTVPKNDASDIRAYLEAHAVEQNWLEGMINKISAFTVAELGEMLPANLWNGKGDKVRWLSIDENEDGEWNIEYAYECRGVYDESVQTAPTEADARAKMLIYLLENKLI